MAEAFHELMGDPPPDGARCWPWVRCARNDKGYGAFCFDGKTLAAHVAAYRIFNGAIPAGWVVRHTCDNPPCCNPAHLLVGTNENNMADAVERARISHGARHYLTRLTEQDIRIIRAERASGTSLAELAQRYEMTQQGISMIARRVNWKHVE